MGRSASHIALHCAMQTQPNLTLIGEEIASESKTLSDVVDLLVKLVIERSTNGKDYGVVLIPEGLIEFIPEVKSLIKELNLLIAQGQGDVVNALSEKSKALFLKLPKELQISFYWIVTLMATCSFQR